MAWVDDRIWCHPKFTDLSAPAFRAYVQGLAYASGMNTLGHLSRDQQRLVGATPKVRKELIFSRLWDENQSGNVRIHDWDDHNEKRDQRKAADRERKRLARAKEREQESGQSAGQSPGTSAGQSRGTSTTSAHVDRVKEVTSEETLPTPPVARHANGNHPTDDEPEIYEPPPLDLEHVLKDIPA